jgi:hypothetical protein
MHLEHMELNADAYCGKVLMSDAYFIAVKKGKTIPVQAWTGPGVPGG